VVIGCPGGVRLANVIFCWRGDKCAGNLATQLLAALAANNKSYYDFYEVRVNIVKVKSINLMCMLVVVVLGLSLQACDQQASKSTNVEDQSTHTLASSKKLDDYSVSQYYENGYLKEESVEKLRKQQYFAKALTAYEFSLPIAAVQKWHRGFLAEAEYGDWLFYDNHAQKVPILTANQSTPYTLTYVDLTKSAYYIEIPAGRIGGLVLDIYQRPQADLGILGADEGRGGKYLLVGPTQTVPEGHDAEWVVKSNCNLVFLGTRIIGYNAAETAKLRRQHFVYPVDGAKDKQKYIAASQTPQWVGSQAVGLQYWQDVYDVLKNEPVEDVNRLILTLVRDLGIQKSTGFIPNDEQKDILTAAAVQGEAVAMVNTFSKRSYKARHWPDRHWLYVLNQTRLDLKHADYYEAKEIASYTYEAFSTSKGMVLPTRNQGSKYLGVYIDQNEEWLDGTNLYEFIIPANAPAKDFWSIAIYNNKFRNLIDNKQGQAVVSSRSDLKVEQDGSVKVYVGPTAPEGYESNWVQSNVGEGFFAYLRLYGPTEAYYDKSWKMPDVRKVE